MLKNVFKLRLRALEGVINSLFRLMNSPDYSCISKRAKTVLVRYQLPSQGPIAHLVIDSTGLKVFGEGEWKTREHGKEKRRIWRKVLMAVDAQSYIVIAAEVSLVQVTDNEVMPTLIKPLRRKIRQVSADGAYDTRDCHALLKRRGIKATIPPRKNAVLWDDGHAWNNAVLAQNAGNLSVWKNENQYHERSKAETAMYRYKVVLNNFYDTGIYQQDLFCEQTIRENSKPLMQVLDTINHSCKGKIWFAGEGITKAWGMKREHLFIISLHNEMERFADSKMMFVITIFCPKVT